MLKNANEDEMCVCGEGLIRKVHPPEQSLILPVTGFLLFHFSRLSVNPVPRCHGMASRAGMVWHVEPWYGVVSPNYPAENSFSSPQLRLVESRVQSGWIRRDQEAVLTSVPVRTRLAWAPPSS